MYRYLDSNASSIYWWRGAPSRYLTRFVPPRTSRAACDGVIPAVGRPLHVESSALHASWCFFPEWWHGRQSSRMKQAEKKRADKTRQSLVRLGPGHHRCGACSWPYRNHRSRKSDVKVLVTTAWPLS